MVEIGAAEMAREREGVGAEVLQALLVEFLYGVQPGVVVRDPFGVGYVQAGSSGVHENAQVGSAA